MDNQEVKKYFSCHLKANGFVPNSGNRLFVKDLGFYLIVVEIVPFQQGAGILLDVGVKFLWCDNDFITYDYSNNNIRINVCDHPLGALVFDDPNVELKLKTLMDDAMVKINEYHELKDFNCFFDRIKNRDDAVKYLNKDFEKRDVDLAIAKMFAGETADAKEILLLASVHNPSAARLLKKCDDLDLFQNELIDIINNCKNMMTKKFKKSLKPIQSIWI